MKLCLSLFCALGVLLGTACRTPQAHVHEISSLSPEQNAKNLEAFAELTVRLEPNEADPSNPRILVSIMNGSPTRDVRMLSNDEFSISMYSPPIYAHRGNLVIWKDGERLWDIEPSQYEMYLTTFPMLEEVTLQPGIGYIFSFQVKDQLPLDERPRDFDERNFMQHSVVGYPVNPFVEPGTYSIAYELLLSTTADEEAFSRRLISNKVTLEIE